MTEDHKSWNGGSRSSTETLKRGFHRFTSISSLLSPISVPDFALLQGVNLLKLFDPELKALNALVISHGPSILYA
jgi:hypothetical protein